MEPTAPTGPTLLSPPPTGPKVPGLTRNVANRCWYARITRRRWKYAKYFHDRQHGGDTEAARQAAIAWLEELRRKLPDPVPRRDRMTSRNKSGFVGVRRVTEVVKRMGGHKYYHWEGRWETARAGRRFSVIKYGEDKAFLLACIARDLYSGDDAVCEAEFERRQRDGRNVALLQRRREVENASRTGQLLRAG
jgi:hypothetical protein